MTRAEFNTMDFESLMVWATENLNDITIEEILKEFAIKKLQEDNFGLAAHIISAIYNNPYDTEYYLYDYSMGTLETPTPITEKEDIEHLIDFEEV